MRLQYSKGDTGLPGYNLPYQMMGTRIVGVWFHCDSSVSKDDERCWHTDPSFRTVDRILYYTYYSYAPIWSLTSSTCVRPCSFLSASKPQRLTSESLISILLYISIVSYYSQFQNYPLIFINITKQTMMSKLNYVDHNDSNTQYSRLVHYKSATWFSKLMRSRPYTFFFDRSSYWYCFDRIYNFSLFFPS